MRVWAMGTGGEFLFGVPKESFSRLNAVYDREITPRLKEGVFLDRQSFFLGHVERGRRPRPARGSRRRRGAVGRRAGPAPPVRRPLRGGLRPLGPAQDGRRCRPRQPLPEAGGARARVVPPRTRARGRRERGGRRGGAGVHLPLDPAPHLGLRGRDRARGPPGLALRLPHRDLVPHRPRRVPDRPARGREDPHLPRLRARGERRGLLPALRPGPVGLLLRDLPLPAEAGLGVLPVVPHGDQAPVGGDGRGGSMPMPLRPSGRAGRRQPTARRLPLRLQRPSVGRVLVHDAAGHGSLPLVLVLVPRLARRAVGARPRGVARRRDRVPARAC